MPNEQQLPDVFSMLFAEDIHRDSYSRKFTLLGIYSTVGAPSFPWKQTLLVYLAFSDGLGKWPLTIRLVEATEEQAPLFTRDREVYFPNPLTVVEIAFIEPEVVFPKAGEYRLQLFISGTLVRERRLSIAFAPMNGRRW